MTISKDRFLALLERAKANAAARREHEAVEAASSLSLQIEEKKVEEVDLTLAGAGPNATDEERTEVLENLLSAGAGTHKQSSNASNLALLSSLTKKLGVSTVSSPSSSLSHQYEDARVSTEVKIAPLPSLPLERSKEIGVARNIILNEKQSLFNTTVLSGEDVVLIGAAGTGKTTSMRNVTRNLIDTKKLPLLGVATRYLIVGSPGAVVVSFTKKAVNNIRHAVVEELKHHVLTLHKLLEYQPEFYEIEDPNNPGAFKNTMRFVPTKTKLNPLPESLVFIAFEESSMISVELYKLLEDAMPHKHQEVFLGDIQQLPPIFGQAILGFKMLELPVVELTEVYRQALESPIIDLAWKILEGKTEAFSPKTESYKVNGKDRVRVLSLEALSRKVTLPDGSESEVKFQPWQKPLSADIALPTAIKQFCTWEDAGYYDAEEDIILCPFNKSLGTIEFNKGISDYLGRKRNADVYEVIAGFNKHYLAVGDRVLYDKEDAFITSIRRNAEYLGKSPLPHHNKLNRWGHIDTRNLDDNEQFALQAAAVEGSNMDLAAIEAFMSSAAEDATERVQAASHIVEIRYAYQEDFDDPIVLSGATDINNLLGGYCITVHKFQGSEADKVFLLFHNSHAVMMQRELLYTAVTRAKKFLHIICERDTFFKGVKSQKIKGNTIVEKAEWFKGKQTDYQKQKSLSLTGKQ